MKFNFLTSISALLLGGAIVAAVPGVAAASTITLTSTTGFLPTDLSRTPNGNTDLNVPLFNSQGGTLSLTGISITVTENEYSTGTITNSAQSLTPLDVTGQVSSNWSFGSSGVSSLDSFLTAQATGIKILTQFSSTGLAPGSSVAYAPVPGGSSANPATFSATFSPTDLSNYSSLTAGNDIQALINTLTTTLAGQTGSGGNTNVSSSINTFADLDISVTYTYGTAAPEPMTLGLVATGITGLGLLRRRKKSAKA